MFWILLPAVGMLLMDKRTIVRFCYHNITHISKATDSRCFKKYQNRIQNPVEQLRQSFLRKYFQLGSVYASENFSLYFHRTLRIKSVKKSFFGINGIMEVKIMEIINNFSEHNYSLHSISTKSSCLWYFTVQLVSVLNLTLKFLQQNKTAAVRTCSKEWLIWKFREISKKSIDVVKLCFSKVPNLLSATCKTWDQLRRNFSEFSGMFRSDEKRIYDPIKPLH